MQKAKRILILAALGCGRDDPAPPTPEGAPPSEIRDPFRRITPDAIVAAVDSAVLTCDLDDWVFVTEVAGRVSSARVVLVQTEGEQAALEWTLAPEPTATGSLWTRFSHRHTDKASPCLREATVLVEARDSTGETVDCLAFGPGAADLVAGGLGDRLTGIARGDWSACRIR